MQAFVFSFPDKVDKYVFFEHQGEELLHVLSGTLEWQVGSDKFIVEAGDTVHFDSSIPHRGHSIGGPASALMVMYSPDHKHDELA
jgi:quercetin dioxygenase-like cupin family protein